MNLRFPGQYWDRETNSHYNFNRDYLPGVGRYTQADPIGLMGGVNFFSYAFENPGVYFDYNGLQSKGSWVTEPTIINMDARLLGFRRMEEIKFDGFGFINYFALDYTMSATITFEVACIDECQKEGRNITAFIPLKKTEALSWV